MTNNHIISQPRVKSLFYLAALLPLLLILNTYFGINKMSIKNVLIVGAGGNLGPSILSVFLDSSFNTSVLTRESSSKTFPSGAKVVKADYGSSESLAAAFKGQDAVISLVGSEGMQGQQQLIDAAIAAGVKRFIPSEFGSNTEDPRVLKLVPPFAGKVQVVKYLESREDQISWTSVINGPFFDWGLKVGFLGLNGATKTATLMDGGEATFSTTNLRQIGHALVKILEKADLTKNKNVYISSFEVTQKELLAAAEKVTGEKWTVEHETSKKLFEVGNEKLSKGDFSGVMPLIRGAAFGEDNLGDLRPVGLWNEKLGLEKENFEESVKAGLSGKVYGEK